MSSFPHLYKTPTRLTEHAITAKITSKHLIQPRPRHSEIKSTNMKFAPIILAALLTLVTSEPVAEASRGRVARPGARDANAAPAPLPLPEDLEKRSCTYNGVSLSIPQRLLAHIFTTDSLYTVPFEPLIGDILTFNPCQQCVCLSGSHGKSGVFCADCWNSAAGNWQVVDLGSGTESDVYQCNTSGGCCDYGYASDCKNGATGRCG